MSDNQARYSLAIGDNSIDVTNKIGQKVLSMAFMRTIRVPDNDQINNLPPSLGEFPLYKIRDHPKNLAKKMVAKGGAFFPMHEMEAMWIDFDAKEPFIVKVYAGGVNVISGEHRNEDIATQFRRLKDHFSGQSVQECAVLPNQRWLDGIAVTPGVMKQFVAMLLGTGYSVKAQMSGEEATGGLQFEITPLKENYMSDSHAEMVHTHVRTLAGKTLAIPCSLSWTVLDLKCAIEKREGIPTAHQRLIFSGKQLDNSLLLNMYGIRQDSTIHLVLTLRGGSHGPPLQMAIAAGGNIKQVIREDRRISAAWDSDTTLTIPVHILNAAIFLEATGHAPPQSPITAKHYADAGYPFYDLLELPGLGTGGNFGAVKSFHELKRQRGRAAGPEKPVVPHVVPIGPGARAAKAKRAAHLAQAVDDGDGLLSPEGPYRAFCTAAQLRDELDAADFVELNKKAPDLMKKFLTMRF